MICIVLAAGYATRLYPITKDFPKPLLQVKGKTILDWLIDDIDGTGDISEYAVVSNHRFFNHFEKWANGKKQKITVLDDGTCTNETRLGAVKDMCFAVNKLNIDGDVLVIAGDNLLDFSLKVFVNYAKKKGFSSTMRYCEVDENKLKKCGTAQTDENDRITSMKEKSPFPESHWVCPAFYYFRKEDIKLLDAAISEGCGTDAPGSFVAWLSSKVPFYAMEMPGKRYDVGTVETYLQICDNYKGIGKE